MNQHQKEIYTAKGKRNYTDKPLKLKIYTVFNKYGINLQAYCGGDFVGNHVRKFVQFSIEICAECTALIKEVPYENRRPNSKHGKMSNEDIYAKTKMLQNILLLSDRIYSMCQNPCGMMNDADLAHMEKLWRSSQNYGEIICR